MGLPKEEVWTNCVKIYFSLATKTGFFMTSDKST